MAASGALACAGGMRRLRATHLGDALQVHLHRLFDTVVEKIAMLVQYHRVGVAVRHSARLSENHQKSEKPVRQSETPRRRPLDALVRRVTRRPTLPASLGDNTGARFDSPIELLVRESRRVLSVDVFNARAQQRPRLLGIVGIHLYLV